VASARMMRFDGNFVLGRYLRRRTVAATTAERARSVESGRYGVSLVCVEFEDGGGAVGPIWACCWMLMPGMLSAVEELPVVILCSAEASVLDSAHAPWQFVGIAPSNVGRTCARGPRVRWWQP